MNEIIKSDNTNSGIATAMELLKKWELPQLCDVFRDQEISVRALKYLTESEIRELIPKMGLRVIFREMLNKWRREEESLTKKEFVVAEKQAYDALLELPTSTQDSLKEKTEETQPKVTKVIENQKSDANPSLQNTIELSPFIMKCEINSDDSNDMYTLNDELIIGASTPLPSSQNQQSLMDVESAANNDEKRTTKKQSQLEILQNNEKFDVHELISKSAEGEKIFDYNQKNGILDMKNRKRIVKIIMTNAVESRLKMRTAIYYDIINQILKIFPTEKREVYFVPSSHGHHHSSKGMLYYKFSNLKRRLRKSI